jgi:hypothetical protein
MSTKLICATIASAALMFDPAAALPISPAPSNAPVMRSEAPIVSVAYGHYRRVARRTTRRAIRHY